MKRKRWFVPLGAFAFGSAVVVGVLSGSVSHSLVGGAVGFVLGLLTASSLALTWLVAFPIASNLSGSVRETHDLVDVRPLVGPFPVAFGGWAIDERLALVLASAVVEFRPQLIVECGSGISTLVLARCLKELGEGQLISLEHDPSYAVQTQRLLDAAGVSGAVQIINAPLQDIALPSGEVMRWYSGSDVIPGQVGLVVVDGPPGATGPLARYPVLPILRERLSPGAVVLLDDGQRPDESAVARRWVSEFGGRLDYSAKGRGLWRLNLP